MSDTTQWKSQLRRGVLELCILALIEKGPRYGYDIVTQLAGRPTLAPSEGTVYPLLRRLRQEGLLETYWQESETGPPRQYYQLTRQGHEALHVMRSDWNSLMHAVNHHVAETGDGGRDSHA